MKLSAREKCKLAGLLARHQPPDPDGVGTRQRHALPGLPEGFVRSILRHCPGADENRPPHSPNPRAPDAVDQLYEVKPILK